MSERQTGTIYCRSCGIDLPRLCFDLPGEEPHPGICCACDPEVREALAKLFSKFWP